MEDLYSGGKSTYGSSCRPQHSPNDGGYEAGSIEAEGMPGPKDVGLVSSVGPMNGSFNEAQMNAFAGQLGRPTASGEPDNMTGAYGVSGENGNPTAAEGALGVEEYPRMRR